MKAQKEKINNIEFCTFQKLEWIPRLWKQRFRGLVSNVTWKHYSQYPKISKKWKHRSPSLNEWINKCSISMKWNIIQPYYNEILKLATTYIWKCMLNKEDTKGQILYDSALWLTLNRQVHEDKHRGVQEKGEEGEFGTLLLATKFLCRWQKISGTSESGCTKLWM